MLARRRRRREEARSAKALEQAAQKQVAEELEMWRRRVALARSERLQQRELFQEQEQELREEYEYACQQLEQRRSTLLATTSLIPYTQTIQAASNFRVPAALLTLQARLCLHVHCLCIHEELLLKTKEQGWDTIAWMEDCTKQLRILTQKQILLLQTKMHRQVDQLKQMDPDIEIAPAIQATLDQNHNDDIQEEEATPSSAEMMQQSAYPDPNDIHHHDQHDDNTNAHTSESFLEFLQRYEERKAHQLKADQMRLAQFRSRGVTHAAAAANAENPYTERRAGVGRKLKDYATHLFRGSSTGSAGNASNNSNNLLTDESMELQDLNSAHVRRTVSASSAHTPTTTTNNHDASVQLDSTSSIVSNSESHNNSRPSWIQSVKQRSSSLLLLSQSESNLDSGGWSLGSSLRGLRRRGTGKKMELEEMAAPKEEAGSDEENDEDDAKSLHDEDEVANTNGDTTAREAVEAEKATTNAAAANSDDDHHHGETKNDSSNNNNGKSKNGGDDKNSKTKSSPSNNNRHKSSPSSELKEKLKPPVMLQHKFYESARW